MADTNTTQVPTARADVESYFKCCSETFGQLAAILRAIQAAAEQHRDIRDLAGAGKYIADDFENLAETWREEIAFHGVSNS